MTDKNRIPQTELIENCPVCESKNTKFFFTSPDRLHGIAGNFSYHRCVECRTVFQNPMVIEEDLYLCYPNDYYTHNSIDASQRISVAEALNSSNVSNGIGKIIQRIRVNVIKHVKGLPTKGFWGGVARILSKIPRIREKAFFDHVEDILLPFAEGNLKALEIGCGSGKTLLNLQNVGWVAEGIEWDEHTAKIARKYSNLPVKVGDFLKINMEKSSFHLIYLHHVFEHLPEPRKALQRLNDLLVKEGRLVIVYPNPNSFGAFLFREFWHPWETPRHLVFPPLNSIVNIAKTYGFKVIQTKTLSRNCAGFSSVSRLFKLNKPVDLTTPIKTTNSDKLLHLIEKLLVVIGFNLGEEVSIVFSKSK